MCADFLWNISQYKKICMKYCHKCTCKVDVILVRVEFSRQILEKYSNIELHKNPSSQTRVVQCERTDKPNSHALQFCEGT
jgi:hypothetical protein